MRPEVTFNDLEGQKYIAYDASLYTMSMHAKNQVNQCSSQAVKKTRTDRQTDKQTDYNFIYIYIDLGTSSLPEPSI